MINKPVVTFTVSVGRTTYRGGIYVADIRVSFSPATPFMFARINIVVPDLNKAG